MRLQEKTTTFAPDINTQRLEELMTGLFIQYIKLPGRNEKAFQRKMKNEVFLDQSLIQITTLRDDFL